MKDLSQFTGAGYSKGRGPLWQAAWLATQSLVTQHWWCPASARVKILRAFGASIGDGVLVRHRVRIHWPWKLTVAGNSWIGEGTWILNLEPVKIGSNTCISQDVFLCTGSHKFSDPAFEYDNAPIEIGDRVWIAARATVLRGVKIEDEVLVGATALVSRDLPSGSRMLAAVSQPTQRY